MSPAPRPDMPRRQGRFWSGSPWRSHSFVELAQNEARRGAHLGFEEARELSLSSLLVMVFPTLVAGLILLASSSVFRRASSPVASLSDRRDGDGPGLRLELRAG